MNHILVALSVLLCFPGPALALSRFYTLMAQADESQDNKQKINLYTNALAAWTPEDYLSDKELAYVRRAIVYELTGNLPAALADADKAVSIEPKEYTARKTRADILAAMRRCKESIAEYGLSIAAAPAAMKPRILLDRGVTYQECLKDYPSSIKDFNASGAAASKLGDAVLVAESMLYMGASLCAEGKHQKALSLMDQAIKRQPLNPRFHYELAVCREAAKQWEPAWESYSKMISLDAGTSAQGDEVSRKYHGSDAFVSVADPVVRLKSYFGRGRMSEKLSDPDAALDDYRIACKGKLKAACRAAERLE